LPETARLDLGQEMDGPAVSPGLQAVACGHLGEGGEDSDHQFRRHQSTDIEFPGDRRDRDGRGARGVDLLPRGHGGNLGDLDLENVWAAFEVFLGERL
jgi:hypothetical protein